MTESIETNLRQRLRSATTQSHAKLDGVMNSHSPFASAESYCRYLRGMDRLYQRCDASVRWVESQIDLAPHQTPLRDLIQEDIDSLGVSTDAACPNQIEGDSVESPSVHWGRAYVMEGSSMGATYLVKQAEKELPASFGKSFLAQLASDAKNRWSVFAAELAIADAAPDEAVAAAVGVFEYAYEIFGD